MLKLLRRSLSALLAGAAIHPVARAAVSDQAQVMTDAEAAIREVEYDHQVVVRPEFLARYNGPRTPLTPELLAQVAASKRWNNGCLTARRETEAFVTARTREE